MATGPQKLAQDLMYECSRCGDAYPFARGDDETLMRIHRLLHLAADSRFVSAAWQLLDKRAAGAVAIE